MTDPGQPPDGGWPAINPDAATGADPAPDPSGGAPNPWDPPTGAPVAPVPAAPPPSYVPAAGPGPSDAKRIKPASVSGRRPPNIAIIGGLGLLGLLITIAILAVLSTRVLSGTTADPVGETVPPELTAPTTAGTGQAEAPSAVDAARAASCRTDKSTIEVAAQAFELTTGSAPTEQGELVAAGFLKEEVPDFVLSPSPAGTQVVGTGACEGT